MGWRLGNASWPSAHAGKRGAGAGPRSTGRCGRRGVEDGPKGRSSRPEPGWFVDSRGRGRGRAGFPRVRIVYLDWPSRETVWL